MLLILKTLKDEKRAKLYDDFRFTPNFEYQPTPQELAEMQQQWGSFIGNLALKEKLVNTYRLGFEGKQVATNLTILEGVLISEKQMVSGTMTINANSLDEAVTLAKECPILKMGGTVEVRNIIPMEN